MSHTFPLLLKEGWPKAGVVDYLFKFRIFSFEGFSYLIYTNSSSWNTNLFRRNK
jgi:hypothetical protein